MGGMTGGGRGDGLEELGEYVAKLWTVTIMACHEGLSSRRPEDIKITTVDKLPTNLDPHS